MPEVTQEMHEHKASGIAKAGLTTGIIGTSLGAINTLTNGAGLMGLIGGGNGGQSRQVAELQAQNNALRDENLLLKASAASTAQFNELNLQIVHLQDENKALRAEFAQAMNFEAMQRQNGDAFLRQYIDDNFIRAKKCVDAQQITPPVMSYPFGAPSNAPVAPYPYPPAFLPYPPPFQPPANAGTQSGNTSGGVTASNP